MTALGTTAQVLGDEPASTRSIRDGLRLELPAIQGKFDPPAIESIAGIAESIIVSHLVRMNSPSKPPGLTQLGGQAPQPASPDQAVLERVANPHPGALYLARFTAPEFTSLCPVTGQPDFAHLVIDYAPAAWIVESKSLKLYLTSFRNHGAFHEDCTVAIGRRLVDTLEPSWLRIAGYWYPRGGMPIDVFWQTGKAPDALWVPDTGVVHYRGRG